MELKYDAGEIKTLTSQGPGWGYSVHFSPPATPFTISKVKVLARLYGTEYADQVALLEIWDEDFDVLYSHEMPAIELSEPARWRTIETNITVDGDFRVVFFTNSGGQEGGISIGYDLSGNKASEVVRTGGLLADWPPVWETGSSPKPKDKTNWMIRVVGIPVAEGTPVTAPETAVETAKIEITFDPNPVPCIDGYWGWRVILTEVNGIGVKLDKLIYDRYIVNQTTPDR